MLYFLYSLCCKNNKNKIYLLKLDELFHLFNNEANSLMFDKLLIFKSLTWFSNL